MKFILIFLFGWFAGMIAGYDYRRSEYPLHICHEKEYQEAFINCKEQMDKARAIIKGDSLHTLVYW